MRDGQDKVNDKLGNGLKGRQVTMISIGGVIGAGLFVGSSNAIAAAGPAVLVSYVIAAMIVVLVMQMLGEMATARPDTGSFSSYADQAIGRWAGFSIGWLYWWFYVLVIAIEAIVAGNILGDWLGLPHWITAFAITFVLIVCNSLSVGSFGTLEYWLSLFKVVSIVSFIVLGVLAIFDLVPGSSTHGIANLYANGGFAPNGNVAIVAALLTAMFSFQGSEVVTIAAAESKDPKANIKKAIRAVVWRLGLFYLGSMFVVVCLVPWNAPGLAQGSYQAVLTAMNIPWAPAIMSIVVLVAVTSCLNSAIYTASRMAYSLAKRGDAPRAVSRTTPKGVPLLAVALTSLAALVALAANYLLPKQVFQFLLATSGALALLMYLVIAVTQLYMRRKLVALGKRLEVRMWLFPYLTVLTIAFILGVFAIMAAFPGQRAELFSTLGLTAVLVGIGAYLQKSQPELSAQRSAMAPLDEHAQRRALA
ncbi:amino acid permease [Pseudomonas guariconensis]|uniref:amino acid permease n=2 Tax=Pseudomonas TaxID=286 RepID=UPI001CE4A818|nr:MULTISPECIES: amino acid permease [Pseudomonas]MCO7515937.1 amino acid permease [Pseudomonas putida]MCO7593261.1 amino acid permease [Pseudomonas guariconensis]MCO7608432.1 amino acid permease [Pseudomonas guariconensis]MCO7631656.1 amino acid permease [Pseudomonas guariconensis]MCU7223223.1 amino acid permease [Pseudomonas brassicacearum]